MAALAAVCASSAAAQTSTRCPTSKDPPKPLPTVSVDVSASVSTRVVTLNVDGTIQVDVPLLDPADPRQPVPTDPREPVPTDPVCTNIEQAPKTIAAQPGIVVVATGGFAGALMSRLDGAQEQAAVDIGGGGGPMGLGAKTKAPPRSQPIAPASPVSVYALTTFAGGHRSDMPDAVGLSYDATAGTVGMEYRANRNLIVGLAVNVTTAGADLHAGAGTADVDALQAALYFSYATKLWFVDALLSYGRYDLDMVRPGVTEQVRGSTSGDVLALAVRAGYLFDLGKVRVGPIAGLSFTRTRVDGYSETGDQQVAMDISSQTVESVIGSAGVRFLAPFVADGKVVIPYLNVTLEHQLGSDAHAISVSLAETTAGPFLVTAPNFETRTYGKIEGGVTLHLGPSLSASVSGASTFARDEGSDYRFTGGFTYKF